MAKVTTEDCRKFLSNMIENDPTIIRDLSRDAGVFKEMYERACIPKNWKRECKFSATGKHDYANDTYNLYDWTQISATELSTVREFVLCPDVYEDAVKYFVYEDLTGNLLLGEYTGD